MGNVLKVNYVKINSILQFSLDKVVVKRTFFFQHGASAEIPASGECWPGASEKKPPCKSPRSSLPVSGLMIFLQVIDDGVVYVRELMTFHVLGHQTHLKWNQETSHCR